MEDKLSKNDLFILMESYKNNIQLNTTLLEQQKQILIMNNQTMDKQKEFCETLDKFIQNLTTCSERINDNHAKITKLIDDKSAIITNQMVSDSADRKVEHSKLMNRVYIALGGMITIVISLIGLAVTYNKEINALANVISKVSK